MNPKNVTFIIPIYALKEHRIKNLKFILPHIKNTGSRILVVEQIAEGTSNVSGLLESFDGIEHLFFKTSEKRFHKTGIINWAVENHVKTKYAWVTDVDFYMKFSNAFAEEWTEDFIQPYSIAKKLPEKDSESILDGQSMSVNFGDPSAEYISMYGALSFIFDVKSFNELGGMNVEIFGWGKEDVELFNRLDNLKVNIQKMGFYGIHLYHPIDHDRVNYRNKKANKKRDMAVIVCHFNWCNFENPIKNLNRFLNQMEADNIPLYGVELSLTGKFTTANRKNWKHITVDKENICFQKEACLNIAEKMVPDEFKKIAWMDTDLYFTNKNWYKDASAALNTKKLVQLYENGIKTDKHGVITKIQEGTVSLYKKVPTENKNEWLSFSKEMGYPGGALAARRDLWKNGGLYPYTILGGGDTAFILTLLRSGKAWAGNEIFLDKYHEWKERICKYITPEEITFIKGSFIHEWHGEVVDRRYKNRHDILKTPHKATIRMNDDGIFQITGDDNITEQIYEYFFSRNEDGNQLEEFRKSKIVVYTCISGNYDELREVLQPEVGVDYICFTNQNIQSKTWKIKPIPKYLNSLSVEKIARCFKILPHLFLSEYKTSVWVDGNIQVNGKTTDFITKNLRNYFAIAKHPQRNCVYSEGEEVISLEKDTRDVVHAQLYKYRKNGYPEKYGMVQSGIIVRNHNDKKCIEIGNAWWSELREHSKRDQLSFNYSIWDKDVAIDIMDPLIIYGEYFQIWAHKHRGNNKIKVPTNFLNVKNYINGRSV